MRVRPGELLRGSAGDAGSEPGEAPQEPVLGSAGEPEPWRSRPVQEQYRFQTR